MGFGALGRGGLACRLGGLGLKGFRLGGLRVSGFENQY